VLFSVVIIGFRENNKFARVEVQPCNDKTSLLLDFRSSGKLDIKYFRSQWILITSSRLDATLVIYRIGTVLVSSLR